MRSTTVEGATHNFLPPSNWNEETDGPCFNLQIRAGVHGDRKLHTWTSAWKPDAEELAALVAGGVIEIELVGSQPPMAVSVIPAAPSEPKPAVTINEEAHGLGYDDHGPAYPT